MNAVAESLPIYRGVVEDLDITHVVCCDDDVAMCGADVTGDDWLPDTAPTTCPLCALLVTEPCGRCGDPGAAP